MSDSRQHFARIYNEHLWGGDSKSGPGSQPRLLGPYLTVLARVMKDLRVRSVVDIGCGDWSLASTMDWSGISYVGVDIVPELVDELDRRYGSNNVRFACADAVSDRLPGADLCVVKDLLQHLPNASVQRLLAKLEQHFAFALITNDISHTERAGWRRLWKRIQLPVNGDIAGGQYRPLRLTEPPFNLRARRLALLPLTFPRDVMGTAGTVHETKEVLFWERTAPA